MGGGGCGAAGMCSAYIAVLSFRQRLEMNIYIHPLDSSEPFRALASLPCLGLDLGFTQWQKHKNHQLGMTWQFTRNCYPISVLKLLEETATTPEATIRRYEVKPNKHFFFDLFVELILEKDMRLMK